MTPKRKTIKRKREVKTDAVQEKGQEEVVPAGETLCIVEGCVNPKAAGQFVCKAHIRTG